MNTRRIFKSRTSRQSEVLHVLSSLLVAEIAQPSAGMADPSRRGSPTSTCWIIAPAVSTTSNRPGDSVRCRPQNCWRSAVANGGTLKVMTNETQHNARFLRQLTERVANYGMLDNLYIGQKEVLHTKGFLGDSFLPEAAR